jgi:pimeloyl-ACP methyl ester carboxylesterase
MRSPSVLRIRAAVVVALALLVALGGYLAISYAIADRFTHPVRNPVGRGPQVAAASRYEDVALRTNDGLTLRGWFFSVGNDRAAIVVHGRNENRAEFQGRAEKIADILAGQGFSVLLFDLRGHGDSEGERFSFGYLERRDVAAALDFLERRGFPDERIGLVGISMGAGTAIQTLLLRPKVGAVVSDSSYEDALTMVAEGLPPVAGIPGWFAPGVMFMSWIAFGLDGDQVRPIDIVRAHPERPFLFIHCDADELVSVRQARDLRAASANPASELWITSGCVHASSFEHYTSEYRTRLVAFLDSQIPVYSNGAQHVSGSK